MRIDWWTLALQALNFLILIWLLWHFLFKPVRAVIEKRKELAEKAFAEAAKSKEAAEGARQRFEDERARLSQERQELLKKAHEDLEMERGKVLDAARHQADDLVESARATIAKERGVAMSEIREQVADLAADLASTLLSKSGFEALNDVFLERIETQIKALPEDERDRLRKDLDSDDAHLTVVTALPLNSADQDRWRTRLGACLGPAKKVDFAVDAGIIGGAELRFPHAVLRFTWADQLKKAKGILWRDEAAS
jgi:F-type H+-transporting ATPase subunit b